MGLIALLVLLLAACSNEGDELEQTALIEVTASALGYEEVQTDEEVRKWETRSGEAGSVTRSWTPPDNYYLYSSPYVNGLFSNQRNLTDHSIYLFLTKDKAASYQGRLRKSGSVWKFIAGELDLDNMTGDYYTYGFIPRDAAGTIDIALLDNEEGTTFADGAIMTVHGLSPVTGSDVSVTIGAAKGFIVDTNYYDGSYIDTNDNKAYDDGTDTRINRVRPGKFLYNLTSGDNNLFLLFDHLYSALRFRYKVDMVYNALRTIVLKKVELKTEGTKASYDATITLRANNEGTSPIVGSVVFTPTGTKDADFVTIFEATGDYAAGLTLGHEDYTTTLMGGFVPGDQEVFILRTTYDVYDKKGNRVRQNCVADNRLNVRSIIGMPVIFERGKYYTVNLTVMPTYLYVLSEPDLNDPGVVVN